MARISNDSDSDDSLPELDVLIRRMAAKKSAAAKPDKVTTTAGGRADKDDAPPKRPAQGPKPRIKNDEARTAPTKKSTVPKSDSLSKGTPLRRRKLGTSQALDGSLFQKWSDGVGSLRRVDEKEEEEGRKGASTSGPAKKSRGAVRFRSREVKGKPQDAFLSDVSRESSEEPGYGLPQPNAAAASVVRSKRTCVAQRERTRKIVISDDESEDDDVKEVAEESSQTASAAGGNNQSPSDNEEESEFVTALDLDSVSDSSFSEPDSPPVARRSRSPRGQRPKAPKVPPTTDPSKKSVPAARPAVNRNHRANSSDKDPVAPRTPPRAKSRQTNKDTETQQGKNLEDEFQKLRIFAAEMDDSPDTKPKGGSKPSTTTLDPVTPRKTLTASPMKPPRIPMSPWKPEHNEFWDAEIQNGWIDQHSPPKRSPSKKKAALRDAVADDKAALKKKYGTSPEKRDAKKAFDQVKEALAKNFLDELDKRITDGQLSKLTASTGGMRIQWSTTLQSTAGRAHWKCKEYTTTTQHTNGTTSTLKERRHTAFIELAVKVLANEDDLLNTVAHEFCHLAVFMLNGKPKSAHGPEFKAWGHRCMDVFGASRGIVVTTKHNYEIDYKYIWRCCDCRTEVRRHSKSVDVVKQRCGRCRGVLEQVKPVPRGGGAAAATAKKTAYQEFVSSEMKALRASGRAMSFKEMMAVVSTKWKARQQQQQQEGAGKSAVSAPAVSETEVQEIKEEFERLVVYDISD